MSGSVIIVKCVYCTKSEENRKRCVCVLGRHTVSITVRRWKLYLIAQGDGTVEIAHGRDSLKCLTNVLVCLED